MLRALGQMFNAKHCGYGSARVQNLATIERPVRTNLLAGVLMPRDLRDAALKPLIYTPDLSFRACAGP